MRSLLSKRGQSTLEYAVVVAVIVAGLIAMQIYMKRGVEGRLRSSSDDIGEQFDPAQTFSGYTTNRTSVTVERTEKGLSASYMDSALEADSAAEVVIRTGGETVQPW